MDIGADEERAKHVSAESEVWYPQLGTAMTIGLSQLRIYFKQGFSQ